MKCLRGVLVLVGFVVAPITFGFAACGAGVSAVEVVPEMVISELGLGAADGVPRQARDDVTWVRDGVVSADGIAGQARNDGYEVRDDVRDVSACEIGAKGTVVCGRWVEVAGGRFSTDFDEGMKNRSENLRIASGVIDGVLVTSGAVFSFNEHVGLATAEKGYLPAKIFIGGKETEGLGGGICQLSSTLYNAAEMAGLEIVERHAHSRRVYYVDEGRDASTAYGGKDLKFKNNFDYPVRVRASAVGGKNVVWFERQA